MVVRAGIPPRTPGSQLILRSGDSISPAAVQEKKIRNTPIQGAIPRQRVNNVLTTKQFTAITLPRAGAPFPVGNASNLRRPAVARGVENLPYADQKQSRFREESG